MASQQSISNNAFNNKADGVTSTITVVGDTIDDTIASDTADEEISATTLVDDSTNNEGDITSGEVTGATGSDQTAIESIRQDSHGNSVYNLSNYARRVNSETWTPGMKTNTAMSVRLQTLLDWNHASPGPIDGGFGMNTKKALINFQKIKGLPATGKMDMATWQALNAGIPKDQPVLVSYTITKDDVANAFTKLPEGAEAKSKLKALGYESIYEMLAERFHMDVAYLKKLNKSKAFKAGDIITVINTGASLDKPITRVHADINEKILYAYNGDKLVATYPTTIGSANTATPNGKYKVVNRVKMPWYKATVGKDSGSPKTYMLPPGPNNPVGVVWLGLSKPSYGIHGSPVPEGISRQASLGCIRLTNWDVLEVFDNIKVGAVVEIS